MKLFTCTTLQSALLSVALSVTLGATAPAFAAGTDETPTAPAAVNDLDQGRNAVKAKQWAKEIGRASCRERVCYPV